MTDESLWPARNVAEYAYCPRLFYFMQVEGVFLPSTDTEKGAAVHRRVDRPSVASAPPTGSSPNSDATPGAPSEPGEGTAKPTEVAEASTEPQRPKTVRSLALTSKTLGLTATLDLAEIAGQRAIPVEYRKGRPKRTALAPPPDDPGESDQPSLSIDEPWPTDRVQVGLQAILLEEAGYSVPEAVLYYAEEKLRLRVPVNEALKAEALATLESAKKCSQSPRPLPLVNDPRCIRCSLQPICLPDEVNQQRELAPGETVSPRKIWPPLDEGIHVVAQQNGSKIGINGMTLTVTDRKGTKLKDIPLASLESLSLLGSVQLTTQAIHALADRVVPVAFLSSAGRLVAMIDPLDSVSAEIRRAQIRKLDDPVVCLDLARALVTAKVINQRTLLLRNHEKLPPAVATELSHDAERASKAGSVDLTRGHEGQAAAVYFEHFAGMIKGPLAAEFDVNGRQRRPPPDPINSCLSMAYTMLTHECVAALRLARLEPSIGGFHVSRPGRPAFALDLMEPFRPLIADSVTISCFNRGELTEGHFLRTSAGCALTDAGRKAFFGAYGRRMETEVTHPVFGYRLSYRRMVILHARMIAAWFMGEVPSLAFLTTR